MLFTINSRHLNLIYLALIACVLSIFSSSAQAQPSDSLPVHLCKKNEPINIEGFVHIGGISQWLQIRSDNCQFPIILFLHGGPANPLSPYADSIYQDWQQKFTLVQWDQRASGKTWLKNPDSASTPLSLAQMADDGITLTHYLNTAFPGTPIILSGSSWGAALGVAMVQRKPQLFAAYVGTAQLVSGSENTLATYQQLLHLLKTANDSENLALLTKLGPPPYEKPNSLLRRITRQYEAKVAEAAPAQWWEPKNPAEMIANSAAYEAAEEYSFLQYTGFDLQTGKTGHGMMHDIEFLKNATEFRLPVYFIQGEEDLVTVPAVTQAYVKKITAPAKKLVMVKGAGHNPNIPLINAQWQVMLEIRAKLSAHQ
jgi:pimeloyl-ACP methyl ester carboxylesterase